MDEDYRVPSKSNEEIERIETLGVLRFAVA